MELIASICHPYKNPLFNPSLILPPPRVSMAVDFNTAHFPLYPRPFQRIPKRSSIAYAKKKNAQREPVVSPSVVEELTVVNEDFQDDIFIEDFQDDQLVDDDGGDFEDEYLEEEAEPSVGDGAGGGGISLAGTSWDQKALDLAQEVTVSFDGELGIYAFRTLLNASIQVRIERLTNKSGSPNMADIEDFTTRYQARLDEAEATGSIPVNIYLEVSSPGVERVVRIPEDFERFKDRNLYVKYAFEAVGSSSFSEHDGVFRLLSYDSGAKSCTWGLANVRVNRENSGKGRPLSKKQKEWRLETPLDSLRLVRLYSEI
ncbi:ribosome maturation factor RimP [Striga asiatica]|uniref:Ribosome maturation factor RimP n=1 Tax=Striga asiatica TaxID=4170 RepID=A0A5A7QR76_STRAF|nr:ribosome maturation factor RimP [Striga asiatica]